MYWQHLEIWIMPSVGEGVEVPYPTGAAIPESNQLLHCQIK